MSRPALALALTLAACGSSSPPPAAEPAPAPEPATTAFDWPIPDGWRGETIPFPLGFAPELAYQGVEELRFPPGFLDPGASHFWSYAFVWIVAPPLPAFYTLPETLDDIVDFVAGKALDLLGVEHDLLRRWGQAETEVTP